MRWEPRGVLSRNRDASSMVQEGNDVSLGQGDHNGGEEQESDSGCTLRVEPTDFSNSSGVRYG